MKNIKKSVLFTLLALGSMFTFAAVTPVTSTAQAACPNRAILSFPSWYKGLPMNDDGKTCTLSKFELNYIWVIVMNIVEILLQVVAYVSAGFIIWGGFKYIKSEGDPSKISEAKSAILNAVFGLAIALSSVAIIVFIQTRII